METKEYIKTTKENIFIKVHFYYDLGGRSYITGRDEKRGYWVTVTPTERIKENGFTVEKTKAYTGVRQCLVSCKKKNNKSEWEAIKILGTKQKDLVDMVCSKHGLL